MMQMCDPNQRSGTMKALASSLSALLLMTAPAAAQTIDGTRYAAIAFSPKTGKWGFGYNHPSRASAERAALNKCPASDARVLTWARMGWIVLVIAEDGAHGYAQVHGEGASLSAAMSKALAHLRKHSSSKVKTIVRVCSGGVEPSILIAR
jgi:serine/threonine-protein kinase